MTDSPLDKTRWDQWNSGGGPRYPHEKVVQFMFRTFPVGIRARIQVLDLGCGSGVHTQFLAAEGFAVAARDISSVGVANTRSRLAAAGLNGDVAVGAVDATGFADGTFDAVISISVLECAGPALLPVAVKEVVRVLKPGGVALLLFASDRDFRVRGANEYALYGFSEAEVAAVAQLVERDLQYFWMDRYITTYQNKLMQQDDHLVTLRKADL